MLFLSAILAGRFANAQSDHIKEFRLANVNTAMANYPLAIIFYSFAAMLSRRGFMWHVFEYMIVNSSRKRVMAT
jgi:hypothetical protein